MSTTTATEDFVVKTPIYGYSGMGYSHLSHITQVYSTEVAARKQARRLKRARELRSGTHLDSSKADEFYREMTDNISYSIEGDSKIYRRTTVLCELPPS